MTNKFPGLDATRFLADRQNGVDDILRSHLSVEDYKRITHVQHSAIVMYTSLAARIGRENWDLYWSVWQATVEDQMEKFFTTAERERKRGSSFPNFD